MEGEQCDGDRKSETEGWELDMRFWERVLLDGINPTAAII